MPAKTQNHHPATLTAFCYRSGQIHFGPRLPQGTIPLAMGPAAQVRAEVAALAQPAGDGKTLLVPGVPDAADATRALAALLRFGDEINARRSPEAARP